jgi:exonuclease VII small subunit
MPEINATISNTAKEVATAARDLGYVVIGASVIGLQKAQVRRQELRKNLADPLAGAEQRLSGVRSDLASVFQEADARVEEVIERVETVFVPLEDRLPEPARDLAKQLHTQAREARAQLRDLVASFAA